MESIRILKLCFHFIDLGSRYLGPLANTSLREVLLIILRLPVITWPARLYMNGKLAQDLHNIYTKLRFTASMSIDYIVKYNYSYDHKFFILRRYNILLGHTQLQ